MEWDGDGGEVVWESVEAGYVAVCLIRGGMGVRGGRGLVRFDCVGSGFGDARSG